MADKLGLGTEERVLKIGQSFTNPRSKAFHTVRYDFKPASVDTNKKASLEVGDNNQVTVTVPHLDSAGTPQTAVFKGSQRPYTKECVLIIDRVTGEITLEKLACNIQVKKTRSEYNKAPLPQDRLQSSSQDRIGAGNSSLSQRSATPPILGSRSNNKTKVSTGGRRADRPITHLMPKHSPLRASPGHPSPSAGIGNQRSPGRSRDMHSGMNESHNPSTLASLPMIGMDDFADPIPPPPTHAPHHNSRLSAPPPQNITNNGNRVSPLSNHSDNDHGVGTISDSSSSSSDSDSDSDAPDNVKIKNGYGTSGTSSKVNGHDLATLDEDLCLSESGSDSD